MDNWQIPGSIIPAQGWQCPVCKSVYAPNTPMCLQCPSSERVATHKPNMSKIKIDFMGDTQPKEEGK